MAGETALSANSSVGVYILEDNNGWVAANTPNTCNLGGDTGLVLAEDYIYFDSMVFLVHTGITPRNEDFRGWTFYQNGSTLAKTKASTGQAMMRTFTLRVHVTSTVQKNFEKFFDYRQNVTRPQLYLVRQWAATTFKEFSYNATNYKYSPVVLTGYTLEETANPGYELQMITITLQQADRVKTS